MIERYRPSMAPLIKELALHLLASDLEEIKKIVAEIEMEIVELRKRFKDT